jgi:cytidylate kinase
LTRAAPPSSVGGVACKVVCISRAIGAGGEQVGRLVAERLGFLYVDEEIVSRAAARAGIDAGAVADEERRKSLVSRVLQGLAQSGSDAWVGGGLVGGGAGSGDELGSDDIRAFIREAIEQTAAKGNVVIVAHAASFALPKGPAMLRVFVTASPAGRAKRIGELEGLDHARAARAVKDSDGARRDYLKRFYDISVESPTDYDLVVNTDVLSLERAAELVSLAASD